MTGFANTVLRTLWNPVAGTRSGNPVSEPRDLIRRQKRRIGLSNSDFAQDGLRDGRGDAQAAQHQHRQIVTQP
jgi:hypothetical protein